MIDKILFNLLILDGNETHFIADKEVYSNFVRLICELTKVKYDIRFCSNKNCSCHPESTIKSLLDDEKLSSFLKSYGYKNILDDISKLTTNYTPVVAKGIYED